MLIHFVAPHGKLLQRLLALEQLHGSLPPLLPSQQHPGPRGPQHSISLEEWPNVVRRVVENHESLRQVAAGDARVPRNHQTDPSYFSQPQSRIGGFSLPLPIPGAVPVNAETGQHGSHLQGWTFATGKV